MMSRVSLNSTLGNSAEVGGGDVGLHGVTLRAEAAWARWTRQRWSRWAVSPFHSCLRGLAGLGRILGPLRDLSSMRGSDLKPEGFVITESDGETAGSAWALSRRRKAEFDKVQLTALIRENIKPFYVYTPESEMLNKPVSQLIPILIFSLHPSSSTPGEMLQASFTFLTKEEERRALLDGYLQGYTEA